MGYHFVTLVFVHEKHEVSFIKINYAFSEKSGAGASICSLHISNCATSDWHRYLHNKRRIATGNISQVGLVTWKYT